MQGHAQQQTFKRNGHINYFLRCLRALPTAAQSSDSNRITAAFFCISALDLIGVLELKTTAEQRAGWIEWIWSLQALSNNQRPKIAAFIQLEYLYKSNGLIVVHHQNDATSPAHIPSTYTALLTLAILRAPLDKLNIPGLTSFLKSCQAKDGSFSPTPGDDHVYPNEGFQSDVRMVYCASVISHIIRDFSGMNVNATERFLERCKTWEGGYASRPGVIEAQGGTTYCSLATLSIFDRLQNSSTSSNMTLRWLVARQIGGFQGRPGKLEDVCYSFWCGGAISLLDHGALINKRADRSFLLSAQFPIGGFGKEPEDYPDPFHSYLALAALSLTHSADDDVGLGLKPLDVRWNVSVETAEWLRAEIARIK
ncbi:geranylgeranyl transferase type-1 subunit beta [Kwoniella heveanensis BCC8398]|uniref:Geranylgeranyl transferase type-1 subunit beta n=1 Tax=Kwoniella heveanensis BCC8398 TaxID=1296120 RepID=A0A1B9GQA1_9TREE|nr:geranylgeranyl transferase type-1 subunit beta [Kwoniella heveanensis BCC8398]